jgi:bacterioferritin
LAPRRSDTKSPQSWTSTCRRRRQAPVNLDVARDDRRGTPSPDLAREYQAIIAYVVYSQVLKGAQYMSIAEELETHAADELRHALVISKQIDYLSGVPAVVPLPVKTSDDPEQMLRFDLENEVATVRSYRERIRQCEALSEFAIAEHIREILVQEQEHLIDLATALGETPPNIA